MDMLLSWGDVWTVVLSGILIVFVVLIILIIIVWIYGQIFHNINKSKADKAAKGGSDSGNSGNTPQNAVAPIDNKDVSDNHVSDSAETGIPGSVIAAISAAVATFTGGKGVITGITRKKALTNGRRRNTEWGRAGTLSAMRTLNRIGR
jgi:Na+-transporting methylmalonyl-CoA/oxaloacetate decarboxylase gamma subunit